MRVLVVEDVRSLADDIAEGLRYHGFAADVAYDGLDAAAKLDATAYHLVVLDRDLPGIHGDALCQIITQAGQPVMILMLTAAGSPEDRVSGLNLGADDYLAKPFHFPELVLRIRALARRQPHCWLTASTSSSPRPVGGYDVMLRQLEHLMLPRDRANVTVQVLFDAGVHPSMVAPFTMMGFPDPEDLGLVNVESAIGTLFLEEPCPTKPRSGSR
jgi:DNA-binding response OmpR family regulator